MFYGISSELLRDLPAFFPPASTTALEEASDPAFMFLLIHHPSKLRNPGYILSVTAIHIHPHLPRELYATSAQSLLIQELVEYCVDFLQDSTADLRTCAVLSRSWVRAAQSHLFSEVCLARNREGSPCQLRCGQFLQIVHTSPHILGYISSLRVNLESLSDNTFLLFSRSGFRRLRHIDICNQGDVSPPVVWAVEWLLALPTLRRVELNFRFPSMDSFLDMWELCSPNIEHLVLGDRATPPAETSAFGTRRPARGPPIALRSFKVNSEQFVHDWLADGHCPFDFSRLETLDLGAASALYRHDAFRPAISTVTSLAFKAIFGQPMIPLSLFTRLTHLKITVPNSWDLPLLLATLAAIPACSALSTIRIASANPHVDADSCTLLDHALSQLCLPNLKAVEVDFTVFTAAFAAGSLQGAVRRPEEYFAAVSQYFPILCCRGLYASVGYLFLEENNSDGEI
ncbi:hypothetical protein C8R43DRAFT_1144428 [Mycena crocata]|nr:hypothetical protein C8R43DRAFT_1144428 [Mycena crocata]